MRNVCVLHENDGIILVKYVKKHVHSYTMYHFIFILEKVTIHFYFSSSIEFLI